MESQSPLDDHKDYVTSLILAGLSYTDVAREVSVQLDIPTSRHSIRRFVERWGSDMAATYIETDSAVRDILRKNEEEMIEKTIAQQTAKLRAVEMLQNRDLPIPPDLAAEVGLIWSDKATMRELGIQIPKPTKSKVEWGFGGAKLVQPANVHNDDAEVVVFLSDIHFPYQDQLLVDRALELIEDIMPDRIVLNGDINDFFQLSRFNTSLERLDHLQEEIDLANRFRLYLRGAAPDAVIDETEGNHDSRIRTFVTQHAKALHTLDAIKPERLFKYDELEINWHPGAGFLLRSEFLVKHGTIIRSECPATAKAELQAAGISGISGHTHRLGTYRRAGYVQRQWTEQGGLMRLDPDYVVGIPNWTQGICVGEFSYTSDAFRIHEVPASGGTLSMFGEEF